MPVIDENQVTHGELFQIAQSYESLVAAMVESNNQLLMKLNATRHMTEAQAEVLNAWALANNALHKLHEMAIDRLSATVN